MLLDLGQRVCLSNIIQLKDSGSRIGKRLWPTELGLVAQDALLGLSSCAARGARIKCQTGL